MKKKALGISLLLLSLLGVVGCNKEKIDGPDGREKNALYFQGTHDYTAKETNAYFVKDGKSDYKVVTPVETSTYEKKAVSEFVYWFEKATTVTLPVITEDTIEGYSTNNKYIFIGETEFTSNYAPIDKSELGRDGLVIKSVGNSVFLIGGSDYGTMCAVYDFMTICFHYEQYSVDVYDLDTNVTNLHFRKFDVKDIPDIPHRSKGYGFLTTSGLNYDQSMFGYRMRLTKGRGEYFMPIFKDYDTKSSTKTSTNCDWVLPVTTYRADHPDWYSVNCSGSDYQWCYTARGNQAEYKLMVEEVAKKIIFSLTNYPVEKYPDLNVITITMQDNYNTCTCPSCNAHAKKYDGAYSAAVVQFINNVADIVKEWSVKPENIKYYRENFRIIYFAYNAFEKSPTYFNEKTGKYTPIDDSVVLRDNTGVYLAIMNQMDYTRSIFEDINANGKALLDGWSELTDFVYLWTYDTNFGRYFYPYDTFSFNNQIVYNYIASKHVAMHFSQGNEIAGNTGISWNCLKAYLNSKLAWDSTLDQTDLVNRFFDRMYGAGSKIMREYFNTFRSYYQHLVVTDSNIGKLMSCFVTINQKKYWPMGTLESFINYVDRAQALIDKEEFDDPKMADIHKKNCEAQAVSPLYITLDLYRTVISKEQKMSVGNRLLDDVVWLELANQIEKEGSSATMADIVYGFMN